MPPCPPQAFSNITPKQFTALAQKAREQGLPFQGNSGTGSSFGGQFSWNYNPATLELKISVTQPPVFLTCESVSARISAVVQSVVA
ncbi:MAG: hypothetical protein ABSG51_04410 [Terracidiphilus sp.]